MSVNSIDTKPKITLRLIFVNILIVVFIIMSYTYISESFGSISMPFINNNEFSLVFGVSLLVLTFFSILSGPIQAFIAGFIGELLFQLAHPALYKSVFFDWCFIVGIFGFIAGIYKYKPLKYQKIKNVLYTFTFLIIDSFIVMFFIILSQILFYSTSLQFDILFINFGFKFFLDALFSAIIIVPILLVIYDKAFALTERQLYYLLLTHHPVSASDHTFYFQFGRTKVYLCSRCSGMIIGIILSIFFTDIVQQILGTQFNPELALFIIIIFPIPGLIDWGTQKLLFRKSTTESRLFTGFIIGVALHFISYTGEYYFITLFIVPFYFIILFILIFLGQKKLTRELNKELTYEPSEELDIGSI